MRLLRLVMAGKSALPRVLPLFRNPRVPTGLKLGTAALAVLIVSPVDLLSDIPVLGLFDDLALLSMLASAFVAMSTRALERERVPARVVNVTPVSHG